MIGNTGIEQSPATPRVKEYDSILKNYSIIDVGIILTVSKDKTTALVQGFNTFAGILKTYEDVELLFPGISEIDVTGSPCILFRPLTNVYSVRDGTLLNRTGVHLEECIKAIPLVLNKGMNIEVGYNKEGSFRIVSPVYQANYSSSGMTASLDNLLGISLNRLGVDINTPILNIHSDIDIEIIRKTEDGLMTGRTVYKKDGSKTEYICTPITPTDTELDDLDTFTKWIWEKQTKATGEISLIQYDRNNKELNSFTISPDGKTSLNTGENIRISFNQDGSYSIANGKSTIDVSSEGDVSIAAANVTVQSSSKTLIKGGTVTLGGTVTPTGTGALCGLPSCLFTGSPHVGDTSTGA